MDPGSAHSALARLVSRIRWRISSGLPLRRTKTTTMPTDNSLWLHDHQGIHTARRNPIEAGKNQTVEIAEVEPLRNSRKNMSGSQFRERALCLALSNNLPNA
jgi:hypothetical protein